MISEATFVIIAAHTPPHIAARTGTVKELLSYPNPVPALAICVMDERTKKLRALKVGDRIRRGMRLVYGTPDPITVKLRYGSAR